jgi:hypothetical protein
VEHVEIEPMRPKLRLLAVVLLLLAGAAAIAWGFRASAAARQGWAEITANASQSEDCSAEFRFRYRLGKNSAAEYRSATEVYTEACARAFRVFHPTRRFEGLGNLAALNAAPNERVALEPELYTALELLERSGDRGLFLAPVYQQLDAVFRSTDDAEAALYDPAFDDEARRYVERFTAMIADPEAVSIELLGGNEACLHLREDYLALAAEYGVSCFADFYWMRNAFAADLIADRLEAAGLKNGYLVSTDGFGRCLEEGDESYSLRVTDMDGAHLLAAAEYAYTGPLALVDLCNFPQSEGIDDYFYRYADGALRTPYLDAEDASERGCVSELIVCARGRSCAELLERAKPIFFAGRFADAEAEKLAEDGIAVLCYSGGALRENAAASRLLERTA